MSLPVISVERVQELARRGKAIDGDEKEWSPGQNARHMKFARESPPLKAAVRAVLDSFPTVHGPADPGIYYLWDKDRVVFVGKSRSGLMGSHLCAAIALHARYGSQVKAFDRLSFQAVSEDLLDTAVGALVRLLKPKYNRRGRAAQRDPEDDLPVLALLGFGDGVRAA